MRIIIALCIFIPLFALSLSLYIAESMREEQKKHIELRKHPLIGG